MLPLIRYTALLLMINFHWLDSRNLKTCVASIKVCIWVRFGSRVALKFIAVALYSYWNLRFVSYFFDIAWSINLTILIWFKLDRLVAKRGYLMQHLLRFYIHALTSFFLVPKLWNLRFSSRCLFKLVLNCSDRTGFWHLFIWVYTIWKIILLFPRLWRKPFFFITALQHAYFTQVFTIQLHLRLKRRIIHFIKTNFFFKVLAIFLIDAIERQTDLINVTVIIDRLRILYSILIDSHFTFVI